MMLRRKFLTTGAAALATLGARGIAAAEMPQKFRIGMAATEWLSQNHSVAAYWRAAEAIAAAGIGATEADNGQAHLDRTYGSDPAAFQSRSRGIGVRLMGVYQALPLHDVAALPQMAGQIRSDGHFLKLAGARYVALGWDAPAAADGSPYQRTQQDLRQAIFAANVLGRICLDNYGIFVAFHAERDIPKEMIVGLLDGTNPRYVRLCADVGHLTAAGLDPVAVVRKYASRLAVSHWKDFAPSLPAPGYLGANARGDFVELGRGVVNFPRLAALYREIGFDGWVMLELDRTRRPSLAVSVQEMKSYVTDRLKLRLYPAGAA